MYIYLCIYIPRIYIYISISKYLYINCFGYSVCDCTGSVLRKRVTIMTNCPWLRELGQVMDPIRRLLLLELQRSKCIKIVRRYKDPMALVEITIFIVTNWMHVCLFARTKGADEELLAGVPSSENIVYVKQMIFKLFCYWNCWGDLRATQCYPHGLGVKVADLLLKNKPNELKINDDTCHD